MGKPLTTIEGVKDLAGSIQDQLDLVRTEPVPSSLALAVDEEWAKVALAVGDDLIGHVDADTLREWGKRVITVEKALEILGNFEDETVHHYTASPREIVAKQLAFFFKKWEFLAGHIGTLVIIGKAAFDAAVPAAGAVGHGALKLLGLWFEGKVFGEDEDDEVRDAIEKVVDTVVDEIAAPLWTALEYVIADALLTTLQGLASGAAIAEAVWPVKVAGDARIGDATARALPQGPRGGYRRRHRSGK